MERVETVVIGGGITGLSAAYNARKEGKGVRIIDPGHWGGVIRSESISGFAVERGPNVFLERPAVKILLEELGLTRSVVYPQDPKYRQYIWRDGAAVSVPRGLLATVATPLLSFSEKFCLFTRIFQNGVLQPRSDDESVLEFCGRVAGERPVKEILDIVLKGIHGGDVEQLSAKMLFPNLWKHASDGGSLRKFFDDRRKSQGGAPKIFVLKGGNEMLVRKLKETLPRESCIRDCVTSFDPSDDPNFPWSVVCASGREVLAQRVVITIAGSDSARLLRKHDSELADQLDSVEYASLIVVHCGIDEGATLPENGFGVLFPRGMEGRLLGVMTNSIVFPHVAPRGRHLLTVCLGGTKSASLCDKSDAELFAITDHGLKKYLGVMNTEHLAVTRWPKAVPQLVVGHAKKVERLREFSSKHPGIVFAGVDCGGVGLSERVRVGMEA